MCKNPLNKKIGIIGGGQLGKMMILEAKRMGFHVIILDPVADCPAHSISDEHIVAAFDDSCAIQQLADKSDVITYEFEHIGAEKLSELEERGYKIYPTAKSLKIIQNKFIQKQYLKNGGIPIPEFMEIKNKSDMEYAGETFGYPFMLKTCTGGYDGKGNAAIGGAGDIDKGFESLGGGRLPLMAEKFVDFAMEISVLACRSIDGYTVVYPVGQNTHIDSILEETRVPAALSTEITEKAIALAGEVMRIFNGVGMFCVEMFVDKDGRVFVNEVAPRPHNSGHYSIEGCVTNQFAQHIRAVSGLPLGSSALLRPVVMRNLLGEAGYEGPAYVEGVEAALSIEGVNVHIYGKAVTKAKRKMGHLTVTSDSLDDAVKKAAQAKTSLKIISVQ